MMALTPTSTFSLARAITSRNLAIRHFRQVVFGSEEGPDLLSRTNALTALTTFIPAVLALEFAKLAVGSPKIADFLVKPFALLTVTIEIFKSEGSNNNLKQQQTDL